MRIVHNGIDPTGATFTCGLKGINVTEWFRWRRQSCPCRVVSLVGAWHAMPGAIPWREAADPSRASVAAGFVGTRYIVPGKLSWRCAADSSQPRVTQGFVGAWHAMPGADTWREVAHAPPPVWSAAACRRCSPSRLAGTCSPHVPSGCSTTTNLAISNAAFPASASESTKNSPA
jgi:hypothetical protein